MENCLFCRMIAGEIPVKKIYEDELILVIEDIAPVAPLHFLLLSKKHIVNSLDLQAEDAPIIGHIYRVAARLAREHGVADAGFRLVNNNNASAGQSVFHLHVHLLAGRQFHWPPG